jgi:hypothetical protein
MVWLGRSIQADEGDAGSQSGRESVHSLRAEEINSKEASETEALKMHNSILKSQVSVKKAGTVTRMMEEGSLIGWHLGV